MLTNKVTPLAEMMLAFIADADAPVTRAEIAASIGRKRSKLAPYDVEKLTEMVDAGLLNQSERKRGAIQIEYVYTVTEKGKLRVG